MWCVECPAASHGALFVFDDFPQTYRHIVAERNAGHVVNWWETHSTKVIAMSKADWCKHYNGTVNDQCRAGVTYTTVELGRGTKQFSLPCFRDENPLGAVCEKCEFRTAEEEAARKAEQAKRFDNIVKARTAIVESLGGPWKKGMPGLNGRIPCPCCGQPGAMLSFSRAGYNGHIHARCSTDDCVSWME